MTRRELLLLLGGAMTAPGALRAQQKPVPVIGLLYPGPSSRASQNWAAFLQGSTRPCPDRPATRCLVTTTRAEPGTT